MKVIWEFTKTHIVISAGLLISILAVGIESYVTPALFLVLIFEVLAIVFTVIYLLGWFSDAHPNYTYSVEKVRNHLELAELLANPDVIWAVFIKKFGLHPELDKTSSAYGACKVNHSASNVTRIRKFYGITMVTLTYDFKDRYRFLPSKVLVRKHNNSADTIDNECKNVQQLKQLIKQKTNHHVKT